MKTSIVSILLATLLLLPLGTTQANEAPQYYTNDPANINADPNYVPGDWNFPDPFKARAIYQSKVSEQLACFDALDSKHLFTLGLGEIAFNTIKNETATVPGYFRQYTGVLEVNKNGPVKMQLLVDINSLDTGVPGRNNRILDLFFKAFEPSLGTATITFDQFDLQGTSWKRMQNGKPHSLSASGHITLNGALKPITANMRVTSIDGTWLVETASPISLLISDFGFGERIYDLLKSCNHKSMGNEVKVIVKFYMR